MLQSGWSVLLDGPTFGLRAAGGLPATDRRSYVR
jgi:hypothetical protein